MARRQEAASLLKQGLSPRKIAEKMQVTLETVIQYLYHQIGEGKIRRSDVVFSVDPSTRRLVEAVITELETEDRLKIVTAVTKSGHPIDPDDLYTYLQFRDARLALGDMYEIIRDVEITLHGAIKKVLQAEFGESWWRNGVPEKIRAECAETLERDPEPAKEPYCYTTLIHLKEIIEKQWALFTRVLPDKVTSNKKELTGGLARLNQIRKGVMHPVRGTGPTEEDFAFVHVFQEDIELEAWPGYAFEHGVQKIVDEMYEAEEFPEGDGQDTV
jgi:transposase